MKGYGKRTKVSKEKKSRRGIRCAAVEKEGEGKGRDGDMWRAGDMELCGVAMSRKGGGDGVMRADGAV